jgi:hypothetical protein
MAGFQALLSRIRRICLALSDTKGFKLVAAHATLVVRDKRFRPAPYVGHKGWVSMDVSGVTDPARSRPKRA